MKRGCPPTLRKARTGELTPPGMISTARRKRASDREMFIRRSVLAVSTAFEKRFERLTEFCSVFGRLLVPLPLSAGILNGQADGPAKRLLGALLQLFQPRHRLIVAHQPLIVVRHHAVVLLKPFLVVHR